MLFNVDKETGEIAPGNTHMPGMEALDTADLVVVFLRFPELPRRADAAPGRLPQRGGPVVGLRTATHAFRMKEDEPFARYSFNFKGPDYQLGFGHQVLGQTWVGHYGRNHQQSTRITIVDGKQSHPILRGVKDVWVQAGAYVGKPTDGDILTMAQPLNGMTPDSPVDETKPPMPSEWTRTYKGASGQSGRVFTSLYGTPEDLLSDGYRRLLVNGCFWRWAWRTPSSPMPTSASWGRSGQTRLEPETTRGASSRKPTPDSRAPFPLTTTRDDRTPGPTEPGLSGRPAGTRASPRSRAGRSVSFASNCRATGGF